MKTQERAFLSCFALKRINDRIPQYLSFPYAPIVGADAHIGPQGRLNYRTRLRRIRNKSARADVGIGPYGGAGINDHLLLFSCPVHTHFIFGS